MMVCFIVEKHENSENKAFQPVLLFNENDAIINRPISDIVLFFNNI